MAYKDPEQRRAYYKLYYQRNKEKIKAEARRYKSHNKDRRREYDLKKNYGLTIEDFNSLFQSQNSRCGICGSEQPTTKQGWHVDHNHTTGSVRGILCVHCNTMLGYARDNPTYLQSAIHYLEKFNCQQAT